MKLIIAGSRNYEVIRDFIDGALDFFNIDTADKSLEIISGGATGIDKCAKLFATYHQGPYPIPYKEFSADWNKHGRAAGPIRNKQMAQEADALLLIWDGESRGSKNMKEEMTKLGKPIYEVIIRRP